MEKRNEIRISNIDDVLFGKIKLLAKNNKRTISKQTEYMLAEYSY